MNYDKWVVITSAYERLRGSKVVEFPIRSTGGIRACTRDATGFIIANKTKIVGVANFVVIFGITSERISSAVPIFPNLNLATYLIKYYWYGGYPKIKQKLSEGDSSRELICMKTLK